MNKRSVICIAFLGLAVSPFAASEEGALQAQLQQCAKIDNVIQRLACFDELAASTVVPVVSAPKMEPAPEPLREPVPAAVTKPQPEPESALAVAPPTPAPMPDASVGEKYLPLKDIKKGPDRVEMVLVAAEKDRYGRWVYTFDNDQIWRQLEPRYAKKPNELPISARLSEGVMGSFALRIGNRDKVIKVKRLK